MGKAGYVVNALAVILTTFFNILFCFPYALPTSVASMNYNSVILSGVVGLTTVWWFVHATRKYHGPKMAEMIHLDQAERRASKI